MKKELEVWNKIKERHLVKLKPFIYAEHDLKIIILDEIKRAKREVIEHYKELDIKKGGNNLGIYLELQKKHLEK